MMTVLHILFLVGLVGAQQVAIIKKEGITQFWYNSSNAHIATFAFDYCNIVSCPLDVSWQCNWYNTLGRGPQYASTYICVTDSYWGQNCNYWGGQWGGIQEQTGGTNHRVH